MHTTSVAVGDTDTEYVISHSPVEIEYNYHCSLIADDLTRCTTVSSENSAIRHWEYYSINCDARDPDPRDKLVVRPQIQYLGDTMMNEPALLFTLAVIFEDFE